MCEDDQNEIEFESEALVGYNKSLASKKVINPTHMEILQAKKKQHERELRQINEAIEALEENPKVVEVLDKLGKVIRRL